MSLSNKPKEMDDMMLTERDDEFWSVIYVNIHSQLKILISISTKLSNLSIKWEQTQSTQTLHGNKEFGLGIQAMIINFAMFWFSVCANVF